MASVKELEWLDLYLETGKATESAKVVFPNHQDSVRRGAQLKIILRDEIVKRTQQAYLGDVPMAKNNIKELANHATQEAVRLKANQDILSRAGLDAAFKVETKEAGSYEDLLKAAREAVKDMDPELTKQLFSTEILNEIEVKH